MYSYRQSLKSDVLSDELINVYFIRPIAGLIVWALYYTPIKPNQVTIASILVGIIASFYYLKGTPDSYIIAGLFVTLKDLLDSTDGQLARVRQCSSRIGRFLDSIGDFIVNVAVFGAIGWGLFTQSGNWWIPMLAILSLAGITLRVSYHVFYHVNFLHLQNIYTTNRITEEVQKEDTKIGGIELTLQHIFQLIYGWQDLLMIQIDRWCARQTLRRFPRTKLDEPSQDFFRSWYSDTIALRISGFIGLGTELFLLMLCSVFNQLELYLYLNLFLMNGILLICILYRRFIRINEIQPNERRRNSGS